MVLFLMAPDVCEAELMMSKDFTIHGMLVNIDLLVNQKP